MFLAMPLLLPHRRQGHADGGGNENRRVERIFIKMPGKFQCENVYPGFICMCREFLGLYIKATTRQTSKRPPLEKKKDSFAFYTSKHVSKA